MAWWAWLLVAWVAGSLVLGVVVGVLIRRAAELDRRSGGPRC